MIEYINSNIIQVSAHQVGNKTAGEDIYLSEESLDIKDNRLRELLIKYFLSHFSSPEYFSFSFSNGDFELNPVFTFISKVFDSKNSFHKQSINLAKHLFECSLHPNIKSGDFYVAYFSNVQIEDEVTDAIGLFKSETKDSFLKLTGKSGKYKLNYDNGVNIEKLDKWCLIFNTERKRGYRICIVDKANKSIEAQYWKDNFLDIKPCSDDYHHTQNYLNLTKSFVTNRLKENFAVTKAEQIDYLNRSMEYFKASEQFDEREFARNVFENNDVIKSFKKFKEEFQEEKNLEVQDDFSISASAVKRQAKGFKSVLKLDKNFHVYIHGDRDKIQRGVEKDGRKFYKIYYNEES